ncbi:PKD domain-containing protein [Kitasatospora sp. NPDC056327]|uniref:PKD domain-containing protein n=1 Tax=Kitasatospora sp. NPDC056327 TaxID=3345785 RepID=UPI0035D6DBB8
MATSRRVGLAVAIAGSAVAGTVLPFTAQAAPAVLYVDGGAAGCSNSGAGTQAQPYCTVQAAADVAGPGQTVDIAAGRSFTGQVTVRRSGEPGKPIVFRSTFPHRMPTTSVDAWGATGSTPAPHAFLLDGVHDVTVTGLNLVAPQEAVLVKDSSRIVLDRNDVNGGNPVRNGVRAYPSATPSIRVTGASADVTVSRTRIYGAPVAGVAVEAGVTGAVVTTNQITNGAGRGVLVTDAPGSVVVSNTFARNCLSDLELAGASAGAVIENNILAKVPYGWCGGETSTATPLVVSAGSVKDTKADYNSIARLNIDSYSWGGTRYYTADHFRATGQGAHDNNADPGFGRIGETYDPAAATGITDAADPDAPGMLSTDLFGDAPVDHPHYENTAPSGFRDRGAIEGLDPLAFSATGERAPFDGHPLNIRFTVSFTTGWEQGTAKLDFGDGREPIAITPGYKVVDHDYPAAGTYTATMTWTGESGAVRSSTSKVTLPPVADLQSRFTWGNGDKSRAGIEIAAQNLGSWPIVRHTYDFGDGTAPTVVEGTNPPSGVTHAYGVAGVYTITETVTDDHGRTASSSQTAKVQGPQAGVPFTGYFYGDGRSTQNGLFDNGRWLYAREASDAHAITSRQFGSPGDVPVIGNWDGTCQCQQAIYRPSTSTFALQHLDNSVSTVNFGDAGDIPVAGKWDGNSRSDQLAIYRPRNSLLAVRHNDGSVTSLRFGDPGDIPVVGDWDGVGHAQFGLFRPGRNAGDANLFILRHDDGSVSTAAYGEKGDLPVVGDWLGKGRTTFGIFRPGSHRFALSYAYAGRTDVSYTVYNYPF